MEKGSYGPTGYAWYVVVVLTIAYVFSFMDRQILNLLVEPIRHDLQISDTQMSLLMGFSFAIFYTLFGIPLGRMADSKSRRAIITTGLVFWSMMTGFCGLAQKFWQFLLLRMGVGVGEATLSPSAYSMIADYFPPEKRATAISVYSMGIYLGAGLAFILGGVMVRLTAGYTSMTLPLVGTVRPWQSIFFLLGFLGLAFALLMFTVREPVRKGIRFLDGKNSTVPLHEVIAYMRSNAKSFLCHNLGFALLAFSGYGMYAWVPTFFIRKHGWDASQAGAVFGISVALCGATGIVTGGKLSDWLLKRGYSDANMRVGLIGTLCFLPFGLLYPIVPSGTYAALLLIPALFCASMPFGVAPAAIQEMMPNPMRGQASAIYLFIVNLIGLGLGPTAVAMITDYVFHNDYAIHYSLLLVTAVAAIGSALLLWIGLKPYVRSVNRQRAWV